MGSYLDAADDYYETISLIAKNMTMLVMERKLL
jgi:hypothetical protein